MAIFCGGKAGHVTLRIARQDYRHLVIQFKHFFQHALFMLKRIERGQGFLSVADPRLAFAVVAKTGHFQDGRVNRLTVGR